MSTQPLLTFKAGKCEIDPNVKPAKITCNATPGYIYMYAEEELMHFCWRPRSASHSDPDIDLLMFPGDGSFSPYTGSETSASSDDVRSPTNGRIFVLKFSSSSQRYLFWMQSKSQHPNGDANWFSPRDLRIGQLVDMMLAGETPDVQAELRDLPRGPGRPDDDNDETMEDVEGTDHARSRPRSGTGGAGPGATGGDIREEGEEAREGGADGGRAASASANDASALVQSFLRSLQGSNLPSGAAGAQQDKLFTTLPDLLPASVTIPVIENEEEAYIDLLLELLPPTILLLAQEAEDSAEGETEPDIETVRAAIGGLSASQKRDILRRVLRSPQFHQSLASLTVALREGGLPVISDALKIQVQNEGFTRRGAVPLGGGEAVEVFLDGVKRAAEEDIKKRSE